MAISSLSCPSPVRRANLQHKPDYALLDAAIELHAEGKHQESLNTVFRHLFPAVPDLAAESFSFGQGSSRVSVRLDDGMLSVVVPLVRLPEGGGSTAALRYILSKISATGQLYQPRLRGEEVHLEFRDRLSRLHPLKVIEVLRAMPVEADRRDDWMVGQFGALPLDREPIAALDDDELARAEAIWRSHWSEVEELLKESQRRRSLFFLNEVTAYALYHIQYAIPLAGFLFARVAESAHTFVDAEEDPLKRETTAAKCAKEMKGIPLDELKKSLGHAKYAISPLADGTSSVLLNYLGAGDYIETVESIRAAGKFMEAAVAFFSTYNYLLARFAWAPEIESAMCAALAEASDKSWREAANILHGHGRSIVASFGSDEEDEDEDTHDREANDEDGSGEDGSGEGAEGAEVEA